MLSGPISIQRFVFITGVVLFFIKIVAWWFTRSTSILTDALESIVNIIAAGFTLYSLRLSHTPKDQNHPYGHGKIEFIAASIEGSLIIAAGIFICIQSINNLIHPSPIQELGLGTILILFSAGVNYGLSTVLLQKGKKLQLLSLVAGGKHLQTDTWSSLGIVVGLGLIYWTQWLWIDAVLAIGLSVFILYNGFVIIRKSVAGIMDESDPMYIEKLIQVLTKYRKDVWIDVHNLRLIQYGNALHIDAHMTLPWYMDIKEAHDEISLLEKLIEHELQQPVELFIHIDPCIPSSCKICSVSGCPKRIFPMEEKQIWNAAIVCLNKKHKSTSTQI
ncbi:MAG: cation diffusion facilitator family transporter [Cytophagaceae bacterium]|jgi:cation diffusion facilitator family transporter|nr:cation diffusion facilitator family transporter [Cytophagaceae bacterium]